MKVAYLTALRRLEIREEPEPEIGRPDEALVRIERVGVCGSDVHYYTQGHIGGDAVSYPATVGHECAGTVVRVGSAVERVKPGDRVAVDPAFACGRCDQCRAGRHNTCRDLQFMGCPNEAPGALAELRTVPADNCLRIPDSMSLAEAVLLEPLAIGLHTVRLGEVYPAARIAILGAGPIGLCVLVCAKETAPCQVYMTDPVDQRRQTAQRCGADWTGNPNREDVVKAILDQDPRGLDLVFECSGDPACIDQALELLTPGGALVIVGIPPAPRVSFDAHSMRRKEVVFKSVRRQKGCVAPAIRMLSGGHIETDAFLTHQFSLEQNEDGFELVAGYRDGVIKAIINVHDGAR